MGQCILPIGGAGFLVHVKTARNHNYAPTVPNWPHPLRLPAHVRTWCTCRPWALEVATVHAASFISIWCSERFQHGRSCASGVLSSLLLLHSEASQQYHQLDQRISTSVQSEWQGFGSAVWVHLHWSAQTRRKADLRLHKTTGVATTL